MPHSLSLLVHIVIYIVHIGNRDSNRNLHIYICIYKPSDPSMMRIDIQDTTSYRLRRLKEGFIMTRPTIQKISNDHGVFSKVEIIISISVYVK
jgi:hypothetical protein